MRNNAMIHARTSGEATGRRPPSAFPPQSPTVHRIGPGRTGGADVGVGPDGIFDNIDWYHIAHPISGILPTPLTGAF
jgi:hypothetical protein